MKTGLPILALLFSLWVSPLAGQNIELGARAGVSVTNFVGDKDTDFEAKWAFVGGFPLAYRVNRSITMILEILYAVKGAEQLAVINDGPAEVRTAVTYLEFPLLGKYLLAPRRSWSPIVTIGPVMSWKLDARSRYNRPGSDFVQTEIEDDVRSQDFGIAVGTGVDFSWGLRRLTLELRYTRGLSDLTKATDDPKRNGAVALTAGVGL